MNELTKLLSSTSAVSMQVKTLFPIPNFKEGVLFTINYVDKEEMTKLSDECTRNEPDPRTRQMTKIRDDDEFIKRLVKKGITGWEKLTYRKLLSLITMEKEKLITIFKTAKEAGTPITLDTEIAYDEGMCLLLIKKAYGLEGWFMERITNLSYFQPDLMSLEAELKNLGS